jgi:spermidine synthase
LELAFIRWFPAHVLFLTFFTNTVLIASFLGLSLGCLAARHRRDYLQLTPVLLAVGVGVGVATEWVRLALQDMIDVGSNKDSPQMVYFGAEARISDVASFVIPIELVAGFVFLLIALTMIGIGQCLGRRFAAIPVPVEAYTVNIAGSLAGVLLFQVCSWYFSPVWWFGIAGAGLLYFLLQERTRRWWAVACCLVAPLIVAIPEYIPVGIIREKFPMESWSPYYRINYSPETRTIVVNLLGHQNMVSREDPFPAYALPYLLNRDARQAPFRDILIIGAGSGNDVSRALQWSAPDARIDAVEIDPVIQRLGRRDHPDKPYQDPRVASHLDDGRNFLRSTQKKYDLIVFALIDSLVLHSSVSNIRLESYLFTSESFADVRRCLKPDGMFVMYNYFRQGWIVSRLEKTLAEIFDGRRATVLTFPHQDAIAAEETANGFTLFFAGPRADAIRAAFRNSPAYFVQAGVAPDAASPNGFGGPRGGNQIRFSPSNVEVPADLRVAEDAWPYLYLRRPMIPALSWRGIAIIGVLSLLMLLAFGWRVTRHQMNQPNMAMFFLGAGFMLLETKAVVHMALVYGSTWIVNTVVFSAILVMIFTANLWVLRSKPSNLARYYVVLLVLLAANVVVPLNSFLGWPPVVQGIAAGTLVISPVLCAAVVFGVLFSKTERSEEALAYNTAGAIFGGLLETTSLLIGFKYLLAVAALMYVAAWWLSRRPLIACRLDQAHSI